MKQAKPLKGHHTRREQTLPTLVGPRITLPTPELLEGASDELRGMVEDFHTLKAHELDHARQAHEAKNAADQAKAAHAACVHEAIAAGKNPAKVKDDTDQHTTLAAAHLQ